MSTINSTVEPAAIPFSTPRPVKNRAEHHDPEDLVMLCAGDHPARPVEWLWPERIPIGKVTLLVGNPGLGKSLLTLDAAARVTRGLPFPEVNKPAAESRQGDTEQGRQGDSSVSPSSPVSPSSSSLSPCLPLSLYGPPAAGVTEPPPTKLGSVLILSASDNLDDTIRPRLDAAGADPNRVFVLPKITDLRHDFAKLCAAVDRAPNCRLIIVDPVNAYVGPSDSHFHTVVRRVLAPLAELATEKGIAILAVTHLRKNDGTAIQRAAGSMGFVAAASTIWTIAEDHQNPNRRLLLPLKNNLAPDVGGISFHIASSTSLASSATTINTNPADEMTNDETRISNAPSFEIRHSIIRNSPSAPYLIWDETPVTISPREALGPPKPERRPTERDEAREFLRTALADGPRPAGEILEEGNQRGFYSRLLQRAFHDLEGHTAKRGYKQGWWWSLGEYPLHVDPDKVDELYAFRQPTYHEDVAFQLKDDKRKAELSLALDHLGPKKRLSPSASVSPSANLSPSQENPKPIETLPSAVPQMTTNSPSLQESKAYLNRTLDDRRSTPAQPRISNRDLRAMSGLNRYVTCTTHLKLWEQEAKSGKPGGSTSNSREKPALDEPPESATSPPHPENDIIEKTSGGTPGAPSDGRGSAPKHVRPAPQPSYGPKP